jgi:hypothetical protein
MSNVDDTQWLEVLAGRAKETDHSTRQAAALRVFFERQIADEMAISPDEQAEKRLLNALQAKGAFSESTPLAKQSSQSLFQRTLKWLFPLEQNHKPIYATLAIVTMAIMIVPLVWDEQETNAPAPQYSQIDSERIKSPSSSLPEPKSAALEKIAPPETKKLNSSSIASLDTKKEVATKKPTTLASREVSQQVNPTPVLSTATEQDPEVVAMSEEQKVVSSYPAPLPIAIEETPKTQMMLELEMPADQVALTNKQILELQKILQFTSDNPNFNKVTLNVPNGRNAIRQAELIINYLALKGIDNSKILTVLERSSSTDAKANERIIYGIMESPSLASKTTRIKLQVD